MSIKQKYMFSKLNTLIYLKFCVASHEEAFSEKVLPRARDIDPVGSILLLKIRFRER